MMELHHPGRMGLILRMAMEEVLGEDGCRAVTEAAGDHSGILMAQEKPGPTVGRLVASLECLYGLQAGQGIAQRIGRACFPYGLREYGSALGLTQTSFRLLPFPMKLKRLSSALAELLGELAGHKVAFEKCEGKLLWHTEDCPLCRERHSHGMSCHMAVGLAEEALYWLSGGKMFQVEEIACAARGDPRCTLQIHESPLS